LKVIGFLFKLLIAVVVVLLILQAEYKGRKLKTYVAEYFKSMLASNDTEMEEVAPVKKDEVKKEVKKAPKKDVKKPESVKQEVKEPQKEVKAKGKKEKSDAVDIPDEDREQLQDLLEKEKGK